MGTFSGKYYGLDIAWLRTHALELQSNLSALTLNASMSIQDRTITRQNYEATLEALRAVNEEITRQTTVAGGGADPACTAKVVYPNFYAAGF